MILDVAPLPPSFSYSSLSMYEACPLRYAFRYVQRIPEPDEPHPPFAFGHAAHEAFEAFTRERRERLARGGASPSRDDLGAWRARSLVSKALRCSALTQASRGAVAKTRCEARAQDGQAAGSLRSARRRMASKPPHSRQSYS